VPAAGAESTAGTVACGGNGSAQRTRAIPAQVVKVLERRGKVSVAARVRLGCGSEGRSQIQRRGRRGGTEERGSGAGSKKKGEAPTCGPELAAREKEEGARPGAGPCGGGKWASVAHAGREEERGRAGLGQGFGLVSFPPLFLSLFYPHTNSNKSN
jgi:hypothetical protein